MSDVDFFIYLSNKFLSFGVLDNALDIIIIFNRKSNHALLLTTCSGVARKNPADLPLGKSFLSGEEPVICVARVSHIYSDLCGVPVLSPIINLAMRYPFTFAEYLEDVRALLRAHPNFNGSMEKFQA